MDNRLPKDFQPGKHDVICRRGTDAFNHGMYIATARRNEVSNIIGRTFSQKEMFISDLSSKLDLMST